MKSLSRKEIILLVLLLVVISGAIYYYYFYRPIQSDIMDIDTEITQNQMELDSLNAKQLSITKAEEQIIALQEGLDDSLTDIPTGVDEPELLVFIEETLMGLAEDITVSFEASPEMNEYYQVKLVTLTITTTYDNLKAVLAAFENAPYRNMVTNMSAAYTAAAESVGPTSNPDYEAGRDTVAEELYGSGTAADTQEEQAEGDDMTLRTQLNIEFISFVGELEQKDYPFMTGIYDNPELFIE